MLVLNYLQADKHDILYVDIKQIGYVLTNRFINPKTDRVLWNNIKNGMSSLIKRKSDSIKTAGEDKNSYAILWRDSKIKVDPKKDNFTVLELWELQKIFKEANQPFNLLHFFVNIVCTINNKTKEWHMSQDNMIKCFGGSKSTINDYLNQLENLQLLYVYRPNKRRTDGTFYNIINSYGRFKDKDKVIIAANIYIEGVECEDITSKLDRRSIRLRFNAFVGGGKKYKDNQQLINELYDDCIKYNKSLEYKPIEDKENGFTYKECLDLTVFDKYKVVRITKQDEDEFDRLIS
jgi:hypothetical protein